MRGDPVGAVHESSYDVIVDIGSHARRRPFGSVTSTCGSCSASSGMSRPTSRWKASEAARSSATMPSMSRRGVIA